MTTFQNPISCTRPFHPCPCGLSLRDPMRKLQNPTNSTFRATPFRKLTALFCRLPLPTLIYRPEASDLGDLLRLWVRTDVEPLSLFAPFGFHGPIVWLQTPPIGRCPSRFRTLSPTESFPGSFASTFPCFLHKVGRRLTARSPRPGHTPV